MMVGNAIPSHDCAVNAFICFICLNCFFCLLNIYICSAHYHDDNTPQFWAFFAKFTQNSIFPCRECQDQCLMNHLFLSNYLFIFFPFSTDGDKFINIFQLQREKMRQNRVPFWSVKQCRNSVKP